MKNKKPAVPQYIQPDEIPPLARDIARKFEDIATQMREIIIDIGSMMREDLAYQSLIDDARNMAALAEAMSEVNVVAVKVQQAFEPFTEGYDEDDDEYDDEE